MDYLIEGRHLTKRFGPVSALSGASIQCVQGQVHALLGANGAGKSTLVKILSGVLRQDTGDIQLAGESVNLTSPSEAARRGVATVFQELSLFPHRTVAENVFAGREPLNRLGLVHPRRMREATERLLSRVGAGHLSPDQLIASLSLHDRQLIEICKALSHDPRVLILDEGTSALPHKEVLALFSLIRVLKSQGLAVIFISHRMPEIREVADHVTVLRDGRDVISSRVADLSDDDLIEAVAGRQIVSKRTAAAREGPGEGLLRVSGLRLPGFPTPISLELRRGEILGLTGLDGQGQAQLLWALFGGYRMLPGDVQVSGKAVRLTAPWRAVRAGIAFIPPERKTAGLLLPLSISRNIVLPALSRFSRYALIRARKEAREAGDLVDRLAIKADSVDVPTQTLSGGNQQKVVLAKWLAAGSNIFLMHDPMRGVDLGAKQAFGTLLRELTAAGKSVVLYSTETAELLQHADRVAVMDRGSIVAVIEGEELSEESILKATLNIAASPREVALA